MRFGIVPVLVVAFIGLVTGIVAAEDGLTVAVADKEPPAELSDEVKGQLAPKSYTISDGKGTIYEFWFVPALKSKTAGPTAKETLLGVEEISVFGAVVVSDAEPHDFRDDPIDKGLFVLRMALQPEDGNHLGTAPYDTFAILIPNAKDAHIKDNRSHDHMVELAQEGTIAEHPPILSLQPRSWRGWRRPWARPCACKAGARISRLARGRHGQCRSVCERHGRLELHRASRAGA